MRFVRVLHTGSISVTAGSRGLNRKMGPKSREHGWYPLSMGYRVLVVLYGLINIAGGLMAYLMPKVQSVASLVVGGTAGILLITCGIVAKNNPGAGLRMAGVISLLLGGFWVYRINEVIGQGKSPMMAVGNLVLALVVLGTLGFGHMAASKKRSTEAPSTNP